MSSATSAARRVVPGYPCDRVGAFALPSGSRCLSKRFWENDRAPLARDLEPPRRESFAGFQDLVLSFDPVDQIACQRRLAARRGTHHFGTTHDRFADAARMRDVRGSCDILFGCAYQAPERLHQALDVLYRMRARFSRNMRACQPTHHLLAQTDRGARVGRPGSSFWSVKSIIGHEQAEGIGCAKHPV